MKTLPRKFYISIPNETVFREVEERLLDAGYKWFSEARGNRSSCSDSYMILSGSWNHSEVYEARREIRSISETSPRNCKEISLADFIQLDQNLERYEVGPKGGVKVKYTRELAGLIAVIMAAKNREEDYDIDSSFSFIHLNSLGALSGEGDGREVDVWEFLKELQALPEIEKILQLHLKEYEVVLTKEKVTVGCQTFTPEQMKEIQDAVADYRQVKKVKVGDGRIALIDMTGVAILGIGNISWSDYDEIDRTFNQI